MRTAQPPHPDSTTFWTFVRAYTHVSRYRRYYALVVVLAAVLAGVPTWSGDAFEASSLGTTLPRRAPGAPENATAPALPDLGLPSLPFLATGDLAGGIDALLGIPGGAGADSGASQGGDDDGDSGADADGGGSLLTVPPPPAVPIPPAPDELKPVLRALSPIVRSGCSAVGLAGVVIAVAGPAVEPVPATQLAPYLVPAYAACATFPPFGARTVCALDDIYAVDTGGLIPSPAIIGIGIDVIEQLELLVESAGGPAPSRAEQLRQQLDCRRE